MVAPTDSPSRVLRRAMRLRALRECYEDHIALRGGAGLDRISPRAFDDRSRHEIHVAYRKLRDGSYRFTPYLQQLLPKGREKAPRVLSIPTVRDRIVLRQLKEVLHAIFSDRVERTLPNVHIRNLKKHIERAAHRDLFVLRADIEGFYDNLDHARLELALRDRIRSDRLLTYVYRAVKTPTVPSDYRRSHKDEYVLSSGVPQGLSISGILANIYLGDLDVDLRRSVPFYARYVDDIIMLGPDKSLEGARESLCKRLGKLGLNLNEEKSFSAPEPQSRSYEYLGYRFEGGSVTVRRRTLDRFIDKMAARFTRFRDTFERQKQDRPWLGEVGVKDVFVEEINEAITGAVSENRRYGWLFYFSEIDDRTLLHQLDKIVEGFFARLPMFVGTPGNLKRFARAYFEVRFRPRGGYILNYDRITTLAARTSYLERFGLIDPGTTYSPSEIHSLFERERRRHLARLELDVAVLS